MPNIWLKIFMVACSCSFRRGSSAFKMIRKECTYPICLRPHTTLAMCSVSRCLESPNPGVSRTMTGSSSLMPCHLVSRPATESVSDSEPADTVNFSRPQMEFAVEDLPWPVIPIMHTTLNFLESCSLPAIAAESKAFSWSSGTSIIRLIWASVNPISAFVKNIAS